MSHFTVGVILPRNTTFDQKIAENSIGKLIAAYDENMEVKPYQRSCYCINLKAREYAKKHIDERMGESFQMMSERFKKEVGTFDLGYYSNHIPTEDDRRIHKIWLKWIQMRGDVEEKLQKEHELYNKPNPDCDECKGTGEVTSTYNPNSKWDWWVIGGRWSGRITDSDSSKGENVIYNRCTVQKAIDLVEDRKNKIDNFGFFAYVTPDGKWIQRAQMGWWAVTTDEKSEEEWYKEQIKILERYNDDDHTIVLIDCHI